MKFIPDQILTTDYNWCKLWCKDTFLGYVFSLFSNFMEFVLNCMSEWLNFVFLLHINTKLFCVLRHLHSNILSVCRFLGDEGHTWHNVALQLTSLNALGADTQQGIKGLVSMRWVFLGAVDVPAHAKSGITTRQTGALWSDGCQSAHPVAQVGDKWRALPAKSPHIFSSITLSQHRNSHCQSGLLIYANHIQYVICLDLILNIFISLVLCFHYEYVLLCNTMTHFSFFYHITFDKKSIF